MEKELSLIFTGDIGFDRYMDRQWEDEELLSREICDFMASADHVVANIEGPLIRKPVDTSAGGAAALLHSMDPAVTKVLARIHADVWNLCNNHIMDAGEAGLEATLQEAARFGARTVGAGRNLPEAKRPLFFPEAGGVGMFSVGYRRGCKPAGEDKGGCFGWNEMDAIREVISVIKKTCRWCIVISHGGEEFTSLPSPYTRDRYLAYLEMGADLVVCHHPHVPMNYELLGGKAIFYSLGNFIFDTDYQRAQYHTDTGVLLKLCLTPERFTFEPFGIRIQRGPEHIVRGGVPRIFRDVPEEQYRLLAPLAAKMFIAATKRQQIYMKPEEYSNASEEKWAENFSDPKRSGRVPGEALDFAIICPLAAQAEDGAWKKSTLEDVRQYILEQM